MPPCRRVAGEQRRAVRLEPGEERRVANKPVFDDLGIAGGQLAGRQRRQHVAIGEDQARLVKGADQVLAVPRIDARLAADRAVDLGKQRRRHLDEIDAAQQRCRGKAREVADDAAAERDEHGAALDAAGEDFVGERGEMGEILGLLPRRHDDCAMRDAGVVEAAHQRRQVEIGDRAVGDDDGAPLLHQRQHQRTSLADQLRSDQDLVGSAAERNGDALGAVERRVHGRGLIRQLARWKRQGRSAARLRGSAEAR